MSKEDELLRLRTENDYLRSLLMRHNGHIDASPAAVSVVTDACAPRRDEQQAESSLNGIGRFSWDKNGHDFEQRSNRQIQPSDYHAFIRYSGYVQGCSLQQMPAPSTGGKKQGKNYS